VLRGVAELLDRMPPPEGAGTFVARMGGEEFLVVLTGTGLAAAHAHLEAVRRAVAGHPWEQVTGGLPVTVSIGATSTVVTEPTPAALLGRADEHLYRAKAEGRDRVVTD
jgi:two-component system cell cycle response regulator